MHRSLLVALAALLFLSTAQASTTIYLVSPPNASPGMAGNTQFNISGISSSFAVGNDGVNALAFDSQGNLYEADHGGNIYKITPQGVATEFTTVAVTGINNPTGLAFDVNDNLYVSGGGSSTGLVVKVASNGASSTSIYSNDDYLANGLALDLAGNLYVSSFGAIYKVASGGSTTTFATGTTGYGLAVADGFLYEARQFDDSIKKYALDGSSSSIFATGLTQPWDVAVDADGNVYYYDVTTRFSYLVEAGDGNVTNITYPDVSTSPTYHLALFNAAPEPTRSLLGLLALACVVLRRQRRQL
jgi:hypothetical protein